MSLYPVFLKLDGERVVVVGGSTVAAGKLDGLLAAGARVTVVAPRIIESIRARMRRECVSAIATRTSRCRLTRATTVAKAPTVAYANTFQSR